MTRTNPKSQFFLSFLFILVFAAALLTAYIRVSATMTGYAIGELKDREFELLEEKSRLRMKIAKLTRKENLMILAEKVDEQSEVQVEFASQ
jgi:Kef-type K+ transport system membrane component KefB